jgi:hypothetical protein
MRSASTHAPQGISSILQKNPDDVVITFAQRSAIGRMKKGQLKDTTVDELLQALFKVIPFYTRKPSPISVRQLWRKPSSTPPKLTTFALVCSAFDLQVLPKFYNRDVSSSLPSLHL